MQLATTAIPTVRPLRGSLGAPEPIQPPPIDRCHALAATGKVAGRYWPHLYRFPSGPALTGG